MSLRAPGPLGPTGPWIDSDDESEDLRYAYVLAVEQARATLACRLEDRLSALKTATPEDILAEIRRQIAEAAVDGRVAEVQGLCAQVADILASYNDSLDKDR